jgi:hypothetical protein
MVTASRAEVLEPSETSTRSGFGAYAETAIPDIIPAGSGFVSYFNDASSPDEARNLADALLNGGGDG